MNIVPVILLQAFFIAPATELPKKLNRKNNTILQQPQHQKRPMNNCITKVYGRNSHR